MYERNISALRVFMPSKVRMLPFLTINALFLAVIVVVLIKWPVDEASHIPPLSVVIALAVVLVILPMSSACGAIVYRTAEIDPGQCCDV